MRVHFNCKEKEACEGNESKFVVMNTSEVEALIAEYNLLQLHSVIDYDRFNEYAITHHSTAIEGSTLTENETRLLLEEGITPKGKPLEHSLMVKDHYEALQFVLQHVKNKTVITTGLLTTINAKVMKRTGGIYNTPLGTVDASKGEYRKGNVSAGGSYFIGYDKVPSYTEAFVKKLAQNMAAASTVPQRLELSFAAHFDLVSIHPFYDGNGRTSRLLMNYLQALSGLPLAIIFKEDKADYFNALQSAGKEENLQPFFRFMYNQYTKFLQSEIALYQQMTQQNKPSAGGDLSLFF